MSPKGEASPGPAGRARYSLEEDKKIIDYIIKNNLFKRVKGRAMWEGMEIALKLTDYTRSALSLKERFKKHIIKNLNDYNLDVNILRSFLEPYNLSELDIEESPKKQHTKTNRRKYTLDEDRLIIEQISAMKGNIAGNTLWKALEQKNVIEGRTWPSLRNRFLTIAVHNLDSLTDAETAKALRRRMNGFKEEKTVEESRCEEEQDVSEPPSPKESKPQRKPKGSEKSFESSLQRGTPQKVKARSADVNSVQKGAQGSEPSTSKKRPQSDSNSAASAPTSDRKKTDSSKASSGKHPARPSKSYGSLASFGSDTVAAGRTKSRTDRDSEGCTSSRKNVRRGSAGSSELASAVAAVVVKQEEDTDSGDERQELIGFDSDNSTDEESVSDDNFESIIDPLYVDFVDNTSVPYVVSGGLKLKLNNLPFPIVDVF